MAGVCFRGRMQGSVLSEYLMADEAAGVSPEFIRIWPRYAEANGGLFDDRSEVEFI